MWHAHLMLDLFDFQNLKWAHNVRYASDRYRNGEALKPTRRATSSHRTHSILIGQRELFSSDFAPIKAKPIRNAAGISLRVLSRK
jgi:hypothetical protein